jgi:tetratricopeptide (TPR) repeat protein
MTLLRPFSAVLFGVLATTAAAQVPGISREQMWPAPTAEDWAKPCKITWQRSYDDALAVSKETGKAILVCVNMDGEIASEHYAGIRYRQPEIAVLYEPYVCVIASVYRHNPRDYDEEGNRILCPRFGSVTCGEHISIEPGLFDKYFEGKRIAPRHIGVELDTEEIYDVYYAFDTDSVFSTLREGIANRPEPEPTVNRGDRAIVERVESRDIVDRIAVETAFVTGDRVQRRRLLEQAVKAKDLSQTEILRLALFGPDRELTRMAFKALTESSSEDAVKLITEVLGLPMDDAERNALIETLARIGESSSKARTMATVFRGLTGSSETIAVTEWVAGPRSIEPVLVQDPVGLALHLEEVEREFASRPGDAEVHLEFAEAFLGLALHPSTTGKYSEALLLDATTSARKAEELGEESWRLHAVFALAAHEGGDWREARARAELAVKAMPPGQEDWNSMAVLAIFAQSRQRSIAWAYRRKESWPPEWLTDLHAAYTVLSRHPLGEDYQAVDHYDFLDAVGAKAEAQAVLDEGLARFPDSWLLHDRLRGRLLKERRLEGLGGLEAVYEAMLRGDGASPTLEWYAGYASIVAAEFHRRSGMEHAAIAAYDRAIAHYETAVGANEENGESAGHYIALAIAGRARLALERGEFGLALEEILRSFEGAPEAAGSLDGLGISPVATGRMLLARLVEEERESEVGRLREALDLLSAEVLALPASEDLGPGGRRRGRRR